MNEKPNCQTVYYRTRQQRLVNVLRGGEFAGALISTPENVQYLSGHRPIHHKPAAMWINADGAAHLAHGEGDRQFQSVDQAYVYEANRGGTFVDDQLGAAINALSPAIARAGKIGIDGRGLDGAREQINVMVELLTLRRTKDELEFRLLQESVDGIEAIYRHIKFVLRAGMSEAELCAECHAAAVRVCGRPVGWLGNDFQSGSAGGMPRDRKIETGELLPLDLGLGANGYIADMCRTFCIGNEPTVAQQRAHARVVGVFDRILPQLKPGAKCAELHQQAVDHLQGLDGLRFDHHLGHGIGLNAHEQPRVNLHWNDELAAGDVITIEPGLYGKSIRGGVRLENDYLITPTGCRPLSALPFTF